MVHTGHNTGECVDYLLSRGGIGPFGNGNRFANQLKVRSYFGLNHLMGNLLELLVLFGFCGIFGGHLKGLSHRFAFALDFIDDGRYNIVIALLFRNGEDKLGAYGIG